MMVRVNTVENNNPPISAMAIGVKKELRASTSGIKPNIVVIVLRRMGLILFSTD